MSGVAIPGTLRALDFPLVLDALAGLTQTAMGRRQIVDREPLADVEALEEEHDTVGECRLWLAGEGSLPVAGAGPLDDVLRAATVQGAILEPGSLLEVGRTARVGRDVRERLVGRGEEFPRLAAVAGRIGDLRALIRQVESVLADDGEVRDDASPRLASLRRKRRRLRDRVVRSLEGLVRSGDVEGALQDAVVTRRGGRYVVPLKSEKRASLKGVVHDTSSSGQTVYVEPLEVLDEQNALAAAERDEEKEVQRLLSDLTGHVRAAAPTLRKVEETLGRLDALQAVARFAESSGAVRPRFVDAGVDLREVRHPLFVEVLRPPEREAVDFVPLDVELGAGDRIVTITGPNTGGKTVALKTVGLAGVLAQCGVPVPARRAELPCFPRVHADIGDEQSVVASLSTFSAHLTRIHGFLEDCPPGSLVLLDELGTGTDPAEGAALGIALVERFDELGALVVASTHHDALKAFAHAHDGAVNAAMEFDSESLQPTYRLRLGVPGRSNALEIAGRLGLDEALVQRARSLLSGDTVQLDALLRSVEGEAEALSSERAGLQDRVREAEEARDRAREAAEGLTGARQRLEREAREALREELERLRARGDELLEELRAEGRRATGERATADRRATWASRVSAAGGEARRRVEKQIEEPAASADWARGVVWSTGPAGGETEEPAAAAETDEVAGGGDAAGPLSRGDSVVVRPLNLKGKVSRDWRPGGDDEDEVEIDVRGKRVVVSRGQVRRVG